MIVEAERYHDISCGHRVHEHESKCALLHGHNYRIFFTCKARKDAEAVDPLGRVIDFSVIKSKLCLWLEENWDHRFLAWEKDPVMKMMLKMTRLPRDWTTYPDDVPFPNVLLEDSIVWVHFNPTAENMAGYLLVVVGPEQLKDTFVDLVKVTVWETRKCIASVTL